MASAIAHRISSSLNFLTTSSISCCDSSTGKPWLATMLERLQGSYSSSQEIIEAKTYITSIASTTTYKPTLTFQASQVQKIRATQEFSRKRQKLVQDTLIRKGIQIVANETSNRGSVAGAGATGDCTTTCEEPVGVADATCIQRRPISREDRTTTCAPTTTCSTHAYNTEIQN